MTELELYDSFAEEAGLNKKHPWQKKRIVSEYATCEITGCKYDNWWYKKFIGVRFFGELIFRNNGIGRVKQLIEVQPVRIINSVVYYGRSLDANDIIFI